MQVAKVFFGRGQDLCREVGQQSQCGHLGGADGFHRLGRDRPRADPPRRRSHGHDFPLHKVQPADITAVQTDPRLKETSVNIEGAENQSERS